MPWPVIAHLDIHPFLGVGIHDSLDLTTGTPVPCKLPHFSGGFLFGSVIGTFPAKRWWQGKSTGGEDAEGGDDSSPEGPFDHFSPVLGWGSRPLMGRGTDAGLIVPHISLPPNNGLLWVTFAMGSSMSVMGSSGVKVWTHNLIFQGSECDTACNFLPAPIGLNLACNDPVPLPSDLVATFNTVLVGLTLRDVLTCILDMAIEMGLGLFMLFGGKAVKWGWSKGKKAAPSPNVALDAYKKGMKEAKDADAIFKKGPITIDDPRLWLKKKRRAAVGQDASLDSQLKKMDDRMKPLEHSEAIKKQMETEDIPSYLLASESEARLRGEYVGPRQKWSNDVGAELDRMREQRRILANAVRPSKWKVTKDAVDLLGVTMGLIKYLPDVFFLPGNLVPDSPELEAQTSKHLFWATPVEEVSSETPATGSADQLPASAATLGIRTPGRGTDTPMWPDLADAMDGFSRATRGVFGSLTGPRSEGGRARKEGSFEFASLAESEPEPELSEADEALIAEGMAIMQDSA